MKKRTNKIYFTKKYKLGPDFDGNVEYLSGWRVRNQPGLFDSKESALASTKGLKAWEKHCGYGGAK